MLALSAPSRGSALSKDKNYAIVDAGGANVGAPG